MRETRAYTKFHKDRLKELVVNVRILLKCTAELWSDDVHCHLAPVWGAMTDLRTRKEASGPIKERRCFSS